LWPILRVIPGRAVRADPESGSAPRNDVRLPFRTHVYMSQRPHALRENHLGDKLGFTSDALHG
jgi:hypothetical protein